MIGWVYVAPAIGALQQHMVCESRWQMSDAMSCLHSGRERGCDVSREERVNLCPPDKGMWPLVSMHVRQCVRGKRSCAAQRHWLHLHPLCWPAAHIARQTPGVTAYFLLNPRKGHFESKATCSLTFMTDSLEHFVHSSSAVNVEAQAKPQ